MNEQELIAALKQQIASGVVPTEGASAPRPTLEQESYQKAFAVAEAADKKIAQLEAASAERRRTHVRERTDDEFWGDMAAGWGLGSGAATKTLSEASRVAQDIPELPGISGFAAKGINALRRQAFDALGLSDNLEQGASSLNESGGRAQKYWQEALSDPREKERRLKDERIQKAEQENGFFGGLWQGFKEGLADPETLVEQGPNLAVTAALARRGGAQMAVTGGAALQGGDVAGQTREALDKLNQTQFEALPEYQALIEQGQSPAEARQTLTNQKAKEAFTLGAASSLALNGMLPGGSSIENVLAGTVARSATMKGAATNILKGTAGETFTEGTEEGLGQLTANERVQTVNPEQTLTEGVGAATGLGAAMGLQMGGGMNTLGSSAEYAAGKLEETAQAVREQAAVAAITEAAIQSGDSTPFLDPKSKTYDPVKGLSVLYGNSQLDGTTEEQKVANQEQANEVIEQLESKYITLKEGLDQFAPETVAQQKAQLTVEKKALAALDPASPEAQKKQVLVDLLEEAITEAEAKPADEIRQNKLELARTERMLSEARKVRMQFDAQPEPDLQADVDVASSEVDTQDVQAVATARQSAERVLTLSMQNSPSVEPAMALQIANNLSNGLSEEQRGYLRQFSEARTLANQAKGMEGVRQEILYGNKAGTMLGVEQYRREVGAAVRLKNRRSADRYLGYLTSFAEDHRAKAVAMAEAYDQVQTTGQSFQAIKSNNGWEVIPRSLPDAVVQRNGGFTFNPSDKGMEAGEKQVKAVRTEAELLGKTLQELQSSVALSFGSPVTQAATPSQSQSTQSTSVDSQAAPAAQSEQTTEPSNQSNVDSTVDSVPSELSASPEAQAAPASTESTTDNYSESTEVASSDLAETAEQNTPVAEEAPIEETKIEAGKLATFEQRSTEQKPFRLRNLIADFFAQNSRTEGSKTLNPLVQVKDFLTQWEAGKVRATEFLALDALSEKQMDVLSLFREKAKKWAPIFQKNLSKINDPAYNYNDMMQFLLQSFDVDGKTQLDLEENIKTAMSYAAFSWIGEQASRNSQNSKEEINQILGKDEAHEVTDEQWGRLANVGTRENVVRNALGQRAVAALGLKALKNAPQGLQAKLESVMGAHIEAMLEEQGLIKVDSIPDAEMAMLSGRETVNNKIQHRFLSVARENGKPVYGVQQIYSATTGTQGVLDDLFSVEPALKEPSLKPIPFVQKLAKNSRQRVPKFLAKILEKANSEANYLREDSWGIFNQLDTEALDTIAGVEEVYEDRMHKARRKSVEAKNDGLRREIDRMFDFVEGTLMQVGLDHPMYFDHVVWKQQRVGIATNMINPQTSKVHRFLLYRKAWETKVDPSNAAQLQNFQLRVLEGLGEKTDKQANEVTLAKFDAKINDPKIRAAVDAIVALQQGTPINEQLQEAIVQGVKKGGEKMHSFDALMALAHQKNANGAPFTVYMMGEVDGVTNGPMLSHLALGAASSVKGLFTLLNKGGFYQEGSQYTQYNLWRGSENKMDLYETTASHMMEAASALLQKTPALRPVLDAVYTFTGNLRNEETGKIEKDGRNIVKTPLTAMIFGSSLNKAVDSMADAFIESIYKKIETLTKKDFKHDRVTVIRQLNVLLGSLSIPENTPVEQLLEMDFSESKYLEHRKAIKKAFKDSLGQAVKDTMARDFALFEERRTAVNSTARMTFALYDGVYQALREGFIAEEVKAGRLETDGAGKPIEELTIEQENQLRERLARMAPVIHTYMSKKGSLDEGLTMSKNERTLSDRPTYASEPRIAGKTTLTRGYETRDIDPGVAMGVMSIHSADSAISHIAAALSEVLNIHDAHGAGLGTFEQTARNLNEATWKVMLEFSPAREMYNAMARTIQNMAAMQERGELPVAALQAVAANLADIQARMKEEDRPPLEQMLRLQLLNMDANAREADKIKLEAMAQMIAVDQYALEGGNFLVTEEHRAAAKAKLADLPTTIPSADLMALTTLEEALEPYLQEKQASKEADEAFDKADVSNIPAIEAMQVLEQMLVEPEFDERTEANLRQVLTKMWVGTRNLKEAIKSVASELEAVSLLSLVMEAHAQIPADRWFPLGKPTNESDSLFVNALSVRGEISLDQALELIGRRVSKLPENQKQFNQRLMALLKRTVNKDLKIKMITPATLPEAVLEKGADKSRGWYALKGDQEGIYVLSPAFQDSQITWDLLMHELVHAALAQAVEDAKTNPGTPAAELVTELETLLEKARELAAGTQYEAATANVHELLAWGLSNEGFQRDVLSKISMESKNKNNALLNGFQKFVEAITRFLFKSFQKPETDQNGLGVLITNASGLFAHAASTRVTGNLVLNQMSATQQVRSYSTLDLFNALGNPLQPISSEFESHLQGVLDRIVNKLHGPFGSFKESLMKDQAISPLDVWAKALNTGEAPFAAQINLSSFRVSEQERFVIEQVEATVRAALTDKTGNTTAAATELSKLYQEARRRLKVTDFAKIAGNADAQKLYDFVFKMEKVNGDMTDHLSRFAAMGIAHEGMRKLLDMQTERNDQDLTNLTFTERLSAIFERILSWFNGKLTHTYAGQQADAKLTMLVEQLVQIESRRRLIAERKLRAIDWMGPIEEKTKAVVDATKKKIESMASTTNTMIDSVGVVRGTKALVRTWAGDRVDLLGESIIKLRDKHLKERHGMLVSLISEAKGPREVMQSLLRITKLNERNRKSEITRIAKETLAFFKDGGTYLTEEAKAALSQVLVRPGAFSLLARFDMNDVQRFVEDKVQRTQAIQQLEQELAAFPDFQHYYMNQAKSLAYFRVTGKVVNENLMMNAHNIANLYGTVRTVDAATAKQAEQIIDLLVPLYALNYSSKEFMDEVREVLRIEAARGEGMNGVEATLRLHENLDKESRERNFQGQKTLMMKGYVPEIYNPNVSVEVADAVAGADLEARGFTKKGPVQRDPNDPDQTPLFLYEMRDAGLAPHLTGAISYTGEVAKGSKKYANQGYSGDPEALSNASANALRGAKHASISRLFNAQPYFDPAKVPFAFMAPVLNDKGQVTNYRYLMQEDTKDALLNRNNRFEQLMGALGGSIVDKETTTEQNTKVLESLKEIYDKEFTKNPSSFVHINHNAADPEMREMYALLPAETRKAIKAIWGSNGMMVQYEMLDIVFGYRKLSLSSIFEKDRTDREGVEKFVGDVVEKMLYGYARVKLHKSVDDAEKYKRRAAKIVRQAENIWQEVVKEVKDIIVVKSGIVLLGNITSNFSLLMAEGVGISDMIRHHRVALKGATAYLRDTEALHALQTRLATGFTQGNDAEIQREITRLEDAIARNPVKELIDAGLMPTIVEDVAIEDDLYSYKAAFTRKVDELTQNVNPGVLSVAKQIYMTHDTGMYQFLSRTTQLSDFVARYTLFQHLTTRKRDPLSRSEAIQRASDSFVNYDIPMQRQLQYLDDMGLMMFTKYFLRIQRVLFRLVKEHPLQVLMMVALHNYLGSLPIVTDSMAVTRIGNNPLDIGALNYPFTLDDLGTVQATMSLLK